MVRCATTHATAPPLKTASARLPAWWQVAARQGSCRGRVPPLQWYEDAALVAAGGDPLGTLSLHQIQFYPEHAFGPYAPLLQ